MNGSPRALAVALVLSLVATSGSFANNKPLKDVPPVPGAPPPPKAKPAPDENLYLRDFPSCEDCRVALAYLVEAFTEHCHRGAGADERRALSIHPNFRHMWTFVQSTNRAALSKQAPYAKGDKRRALGMKAQFLMSDYPC